MEEIITTMHSWKEQWMGKNEKANKKLAKVRLKREIQKQIEAEKGDYE